MTYPGSKLLSFKILAPEPDPQVALQIDAKLEKHSFAGTTYDQRLNHLITDANRAITEALGKSLMAQDSYDDFRARMLKKIGVKNPEEKATKGPLANLQKQMRTEARVAWNEAKVIVNRHMGGSDQVSVWRSVLDDRTTPLCWNRHGRLIEAELGGQTPAAHWGCRCDVILIPNPDSADPEWAALGQEILEEMAQERDQGDLQESARESRLWRRLSIVRTLSSDHHPDDGDPSGGSASTP